MAPGRRLYERAHLAQLLLTLLDQLARRLLDELAQMLLERDAQLCRGLRTVAMCAAGGLGNDFVADAELQEVGRGELELRRRLADLRRVAPQDRRTTLGRNHRVDRVLEHQ